MQARINHKKYGVSAEFLEIALRIEYLRKRDGWDQERYDNELLALGIKFPDDTVRYMKYFEERDVKN